MPVFMSISNVTPYRNIYLIFHISTALSVFPKQYVRPLFPQKKRHRDSCKNTLFYGKIFIYFCQSRGNKCFFLFNSAERTGFNTINSPKINVADSILCSLRYNRE